MSGEATTYGEAILLDVNGGVATLTLNRPDRLNSFNEGMHREMRAALAAVRAGREDGSVRVLVITGAGRGFCAGQDLSDRNVSAGAEAPDLGASIEKNYKPLVMALRNLELPVIAAVNGVAAGAGANIALACDMVFAARSASFIQAFAKLGLIPDTGGTWALPRLLGPARALGLALLGDKLPAEQAEAWGLIWKCVDDEALLPAVQQVATQLAAGPTFGYAQTKKAIWSSSTNDLETQLDLERDLMRQCGRSADYREGVAAFMEKRAPQFTGK
ncbi:2-(1,2-epoxy-1,2-dihydrophenyl)acetyl-CoA isomerase [Azoarcus indigens]|uniref:2-(1,2-epoxy-1,2-dihydrophenyl)acetyl-CoA isomerase n=1 Tax=Azoarcus indigens TaxID=29545 RepID=A0A4R6DQ16_9RHOO|nr:2-(1,2-epoxy-1,2-dihydrophenyl)acetyl-CoA isomerase PaaG [Azoarcus indigens]NMG67528.1 2-(1,2-epoxy-1,2-dihydrophenyl)acetyl-CoA isomerase [Azoarcus indigens]TDN47126.1 2-(1,2-epoxy-1,2-dihydrophenyl)acetyl-CoA isomerase [Azoarcus indigens]